jgi:glycosyltransferase involved in cell wall biosynthesis
MERMVGRASMRVARRIKVTVVQTHPIQYFAPWFRHISAHCTDLELTVLYATYLTPKQQGFGFGQAFTWDVPLLEGYQARVLRDAGSDKHFVGKRLVGLDVPEIAQAIGHTEPDVAVIFGWYPVTLLRALFTCRRLGIPTLYRGDTNLRSAPHGLRLPLWRIKNRYLLAQFDGYLSVGVRAREMLLSLGVSPTRIHASPHSVDNDFFAAAAAPHQTIEGRVAARGAFGLRRDDFVVLFVGKIEAKKRPLHVIHAVARLGSDAVLLAVGAGPLEAECRLEAQQLGVRVAWAGFLNQTEIARAYASADCLALPSDAGETWGLAVNEAMAVGLPVVVSDRVGCGPDLVDPGETGEVVPLDDVAALAAALDRIRARSAEGHDYSQACRARVARHSYAAATTGLVAGCEDAVQRRTHEGSALRRLSRHKRKLVAVSSNAISEELASIGNEAIGVSNQVESHLQGSVARVIAYCGGLVIFGGLERMVFETLRVLREDGSPVHCIANDWENHRIVAVAEQIGASWSTVFYRHRFSRRTRSPLKILKLAWDVGRTSAGLLRDALNFRSTHILVPEHRSILVNALALAVLRAFGIKVIMYLQNAPAPGRFYRLVWRWGVNPFVDRFVCCSDHTKSELLGHGIPPRKVSRIYNVVPTGRRAGDDANKRDPNKVLFIGQITPQKGLDLLLEAIALLSSRGFNVRLDVVGQVKGWVSPNYVGYRERLFARADDPDLNGRVRFLGWRDDVLELLATSGVHVTPSRSSMLEGLPLVNLEAKEARTPSVVFPIGPFLELVTHQVDGWICSEVTPAALAEGIEYFISDPDRAAKAGDAARVSLERFSRARFADAWREVFA